MTPVRYGSRYGSGGADVPAQRCPTCHGPVPSARARYCSAACKQRAYRARRPTTPRLPRPTRVKLAASTGRSTNARSAARDSSESSAARTAIVSAVSSALAERAQAATSRFCSPTSSTEMPQTCIIPPSSTAQHASSGGYSGDYVKGERVLRFEAIVHNTRELGCGRVIAKLPIIVARLKAIVDRALRTLQWMDRAFVADATLDQLPLSSQLGRTRVGGIDLGRPRMRTVLAAIMTLALTPRGFTVGDLTAKVQEIGGQAFRDYGVRQAAYDLKKLRAKQLVEKPGHARRYQVLDQGLRTITALVVLREHVLKPLLAAASRPGADDPVRRKLGRKPKTWSPIDQHYQTLRVTMRALLDDLHLAAA